VATARFKPGGRSLGRPRAFERLSDHCPLVIEIRDEDVKD
jgi:hypothetical protein